MKLSETCINELKELVTQLKEKEQKIWDKHGGHIIPAVKNPFGVLVSHPDGDEVERLHKKRMQLKEIILIFT